MSIKGKLKKQFVKTLSVLSPELSSRYQYRSKFGRELNLDNPLSLNEKLMWLKLNRYSRDPTVKICADKYAVREYLVEKGFGFLLNDLVNCWDSVSQISWDSLPDCFALKCNHGCGYNIICKDKNTFDIKRAEQKLNRWMHEDYWKIHAELNYKDIPRKIICEKFIEGKNGALPVDYKIYCFNGEPYYIGNFIERNLEKHSIVRGYFDIEWNYLNICKNSVDPARFQKPKYLDEMIEFSRQLSQPFPFVRVDYYETDERVIFGEFTFTPTGCLGTYYTDEADKYYGSILKL